MPAILLDGKAASRQVLDELVPRVQALKGRGISPRLTVLRVGDDPASKIYIRAKIRACEQAGVAGDEIELPASARREEVVQCVDRLNADRSVHGILVQLPLPLGLDAHEIAGDVSPDKDVDGLHALNLGRLLQGSAVFRPCTPSGILRLLDDYGIPLRGRHAVVVGRSEIVGKPMALMLVERDATVTLCHSKTVDLPALTRNADLVVVAAGRPRLLKGDMVKPGAVVVDVGVNRTADGQLVGDVAFDEVAAKASHITPVPGGVGPMTVAMLIENSVKAAERCG